MRERREETEEAEDVARDEEGERGGIAAGLGNLTIEMAATEEEATEGLAEALGMEAVEDEGHKGEEGGGGNQREM